METRFTVIGRNGEAWEKICDEEMFGAYLPKWELYVKPEYLDIQVYGDTIFAIDKNSEIVVINHDGVISHQAQLDINEKAKFEVDYEYAIRVDKAKSPKPELPYEVVAAQYGPLKIGFKAIAPCFNNDIVRVETLEGKVGYLRKDGTWLTKELFDYGEEFSGTTMKQNNEDVEVVLVGRRYIKGRLLKRKALKYAYLSKNGELVTEFKE